MTRAKKSRVSIVDVARRAGVSKSTVSLVLKSSPMVREATRQRVSATMKELGYVYNRGAASLRQARSSIVGMVINDLSNPFFAEFAIGAERTFQDSGFIPFIANTAEDGRHQAEVVQSMREHGASGLILSPAQGTDAAQLRELCVPPIPLVLAVRRIEAARVSLVAPDNVGGARKAASHLIGLGHRKIGFVGGVEQMVVRTDRLSGLRQAMEQSGIEINSAMFFEAPPNKQGGFEGMTRLLDANAGTTAVLCYNDVVAIGAMLAISARGLEVGRDIAVVGFDDTVEARHVSPPLTTVSVDPPKLGSRAAWMLLRQIVDGEHRAETYIGEANLIVRDSCGANLPKASHDSVRP